MKPLIIIGAGPVGLTMALACQFYNIPFRLFEKNNSLSYDTKAGTTLTRSLEAFRRFGVSEGVLSRALRVEEIGDIELATNQNRNPVQLKLLSDETRFPFVINLPQHHLEPALAEGLSNDQTSNVNFNWRFEKFEKNINGISVQFQTPEGVRHIEGSYLLACDGGRSNVREQLDIPIVGKSLDVKYALVDIDVDLDIKNPRNYPYLSYFFDPQEWVIAVRQPHFWRFIFPCCEDQTELTKVDLIAKVEHFIGETTDLSILNSTTYKVHHRIASTWREDRVFLMGDAAHLITPMWALGMNSGILDAINLSWRFAWLMRGWANDTILDGYERELKPLATYGTGEMAESARALMENKNQKMESDKWSEWRTAMTRTLLGIKLDVEASGDFSVVKKDSGKIQLGERFPDVEVHLASGRLSRTHDLFDDSFVALYFTDARRKLSLPSDLQGLRNIMVSRWDAPLQSEIRHRSILDVGDRLFEKLGIPPNTIILVRPDDHVAAILPMTDGIVARTYNTLTGMSHVTSAT